MDVTKILVDGGILALAMSAFFLTVIWVNPRLFLNKGDLPADILAAVPPKTPEEKRLSILLGIPLILVLIGYPVHSTVGFYHQGGHDATLTLLAAHAFGVVMIPFLVDLVILDWLIFCTITPRWVVFPGTEGFAGYKNYAFHGKAHAGAMLVLIPLCFGIAWVARLL